MFNYSIGYRYILFREFDPLELEKKNRFYLDGYFKNSITNKFKYSIRTRFQTQVDRDFSFSQDVTNKLRKKIKLIYDVDKSNVDLVFSVESFYVLGDFFEKIRYQVGCVKPISKKTKFNISYMLQQELDHSELFFIMRAKLSHEF